MQVKNGLVAAALVGLTIAATTHVLAQAPPPASSPATAPPASAVQTPEAPSTPGGGVRRLGGFVPGKQRPPGDPAQIAHEKMLYGVSCTSCHGVVLRGGDLGGPHLLRSPAALSDQNCE